MENPLSTTPDDDKYEMEQLLPYNDQLQTRPAIKQAPEAEATESVIELPKAINTNRTNADRPNGDR